MSRSNTKPGVGTPGEDTKPVFGGDTEETSAPGEVPPSVVVLAPTERARYSTDPMLALAPEATQELVRGLAPAPATKALPSVDAFSAAAAAEARVLGRRGKAAREAPTVPAGRRENARNAAPASADSVDSPSPEPPTTVLPTPRAWSTRANLRVGTQRLLRFAAILLVAGVLALVVVTRLVKGTNDREPDAASAAAASATTTVSAPVAMPSTPAPVHVPPATASTPQPTTSAATAPSAASRPTSERPKKAQPNDASTAAPTIKPTVPSTPSTVYDPTQGI